MSTILKGSEVAKSIKLEIISDIEKLKKEDKLPKLAIVRVGENPGDIYYENTLVKNCQKTGIDVEVFKNDENTDTDALVALIDQLNKNSKISGILVLRPLPEHIDEDTIKTAVDVKKDVDCMHPLNLEKIFEGDIKGFLPCTPEAAVEILEHYGVDLEGKHIVVVNRSMVVGKPLSMILVEKNATVTICHSRTKNLEDFTRKADIVAVALGRAKHFDEKYFTEDSIVLDIGASEDEDGNYSGDVDFEAVKDKVAMITPVPGGVGSVTTSLLLSNVVYACETID